MLSRKIHRILSWVIGIQIVLWMLSGLFMSLFDIQTVRGSHLLKPETEAAITPAELNRMISAADFSSQRALQIAALEVREIGKTRYLQLRQSDGSTQLYQSNGEAVAQVTESMVRAELLARYQGSGEIESVQLITQPMTEIRGRDLPVWQVRMDDLEGARFYLSAEDARIVAVRTRWWRIFDFFWMLHIMDYSEREDTSHILLMLAASTGLMLAMTGVWLLLRSSIRRRRNKKRARA